MDTKMFFCVQVSHSGNKTRASTTFSTTLTAHHPPSKRGPDITEIENFTICSTKSLANLNVDLTLAMMQNP